MHDAEFYPEPLQFNGFRFADPAIVQAAGDHFKTPQPKPSKLTDCSSTYHVWGTGRMTWWVSSLMFLMGRPSVAWLVASLSAQMYGY